jgi:hypothetical protein
MQGSSLPVQHFSRKKDSSMRLWTMDQREWQTVAPFVDTLVLPVCPVELKEKRLFLDLAKGIERIADGLESRLAGRILLLPPVYYVPQNPDVLKSYFEEIIKDMKETGFDHLVVVGAEEPDRPADGDGQGPVKILWHTTGKEIETGTDAWEEELEKLYNDILNLWQSHS